MYKRFVSLRLTLYVDKLLGHLEVARVEGLVIRDVTLGFRHWNDHVVSLLAIHLLCRDGSLEMVLLKQAHKRKK